MTSEQWRTAWRIVSTARELPAGERRHFIESESSDPEIVSRVLELLEAPADEDLFAAAPVDRTGTQVGRYQVTELLGRGGMGEVYAARDADLGRTVALKFLIGGGVGDPSAVKRFVREAKAASALNHPNILTVHEVIQSPSGLAIAMELVEGRAISEFRGTPLAIPQVVALGRQVASALAVAHDQGIVHRDIKPENLMVRPDGFVKVLDFGLARDFSGQLAATLQPSLTGLPAGTLRYMSPEQLRDEPVTGASDVFSLGIVLYELAVGRHPFESEYAWETAYAIHTREPSPPSEGNREFPAWLDELLISMLQRDPNRRPSARQVEASLGGSGAGIRSPRRRLRAIRSRLFRARGRQAVWLVLVAAAGVAGYTWITRDAGREGTLKVVPLATFVGSKNYPALSPDGNRIAFSSETPGSTARHIYVKPVGEGEPVQLTFSPYDDVASAWSPDGRQIAFCRQQNDQDYAPKEIYIVPMDGGKERHIAKAWRGVSWSADGKTLALTHVPEDAKMPGRQLGGVFLLSLESGRSRELTVAQKDSFPVFSPNGRWIAFTRLTSGRRAQIFVIAAEGGPARQLTPDRLQPVEAATWTPDSREIVFASLRSGPDGSLWRVPVTGSAPPRPVSATLRDAYDPRLSRQGRLAYREAWIDTNLYLFTATDVRGAAPAGFGAPLSIVNSSREDHSPAFSPDGERIAFVSERSGSLEVWVARRNGFQAVALTALRAQNTGTPRWSPDGRRIAFDSWASGKAAVWSVDSAGGVPRILTPGAFGSWMPSWSPDGEWIYFSRGLSSPSDIWKTPAAGGEPIQVTHSGAFECYPSPDGAVIYFSKPTPEGGRAIWSVPSAGGVEKPVPELEEYRRIGRCWGVVEQGIYFVSYEALPQQTVRFLSFRTHKVTPLFELPKQVQWNAGALAFSRDGRHAMAAQLDHEVNNLMMIENFR